MSKPTIRFKGYTDDWEQRKFGEIVDVKSGRDYKHLNDGDIPVYGTGGYMLSVDQALSYEEDAVGIGRKGTIDKPYLLKAPFWTVDTLFYALPVQNNDLNFIYTLFQNINWKMYDESTGVPSLSKTVISKVLASIPNLEEQQKIGQFFKQLDDTIALHQRKLELLKEQKKGFLQKMFPKNGRTVPEIRFAGFTGDWEQRKLVNIVLKAVDNRGKTPPTLEQGDYPLLEVASMGNYYPDYSKVSKYVDKTTFDSWFRAHLQKDDILFSTVGNTGLATLMDDSKNATIAQNIVGFRAKKGYSPKFLLQMFKLSKNLKKAKRIEMGAVQPSIKVSQLIDVKYNLPSFEEQQKIGQFFKQLDDTIVLHQRKLDKLKQMKQAFLQKMFV